MGTYPVAADGGEHVEVARVYEVENDGVEGTLPLLESVGDPVLPLLRRGKRPDHRFAPERGLRHRLIRRRFPSPSSSIREKRKPVGRSAMCDAVNTPTANEGFLLCLNFIIIIVVVVFLKKNSMKFCPIVFLYSMN